MKIAQKCKDYAIKALKLSYENFEGSGSHCPL